MDTKKKVSILVFFLITLISYILIVAAQPNNDNCIEPNTPDKMFQEEKNNQNQNKKEDPVKDTANIASYQIQIRGGFGVHFKIKCTEGKAYCEGNWKITTKGFFTGKENVDEGCFTSGKSCPYSVNCYQNKMLFGRITAEASIGNNYIARSGIIIAGIILFFL